jgi:hypothetical protein
MNTICKLCEKDNADKTGSHIITHWLIKGCMNLDGSGFRDKEFYFQLDLGRFESRKFIGRSLSPENESVTKYSAYKNLNQDAFKEDYIFCSKCEKHFGLIENNFKIRVHDKLEKTDKKEISFTGTDVLLIRMFFYIQLWRVSASSSYNLKLNINFEERLRKLILNNSIEDNNSEIPLAISFTKTKGKGEQFNMVYFHKYTTKPYFFLLNQYHIRLFEIPKHVGGIPVSLFGYENFVPISELINFNKSSLKVALLDTEKKDILIKNIGNFSVQEVKRYLSTRIRIIFRTYTNFRPSEAFISFVLSELNKNCNTTNDYLDINKLLVALEPILFQLIKEKGIRLKNI